MSCPICITNYNKSLHQSIACCHCSYTACKSCVRYYLTQTSHDAHCMDCRKKWDLQFLKDNLNASFVTGEYREYRGKLLTDRVISQREEYYDGLLYIAEKRRLDKENDDIYIKICALNTQIKKLERKQRQNYERIGDIEDYICRGIEMPENDEQEDTIDENTVFSNETTTSRRKFIMPCQKPGCCGMLSQAYKCGICECFTCAKCFEVKLDDVEHICDENAVATATEIKASSKPCPKCGTRISKIDGCDQMWCVDCKTAFSWTRGTIEQGAVHNPHYFQWMQTRNEEAAAAAAAQNCNNEYRATANSIIQILNIVTYLRTYVNSSNNHCFAIRSDFISNLTQYIAHCEQVYLRPLRFEITTRTNNKQFIYNYFMGEMCRELLQERLLKNDTENQRESALCDIYDALILIVTQVLRDFLNELEPIKKIMVKDFMTLIIKENPGFDVERHKTGFRQNYPLNALNDIGYKASYVQPRAIPECKNISNHIFEICETVSNKYFAVFQKYTAYINAELLKYLMLYGLKKKVPLWDCDKEAYIVTGFNAKQEYVNAEAHWRNIYNMTNV